MRPKILNLAGEQSTLKNRSAAAFAVTKVRGVRHKAHKELKEEEEEAKLVRNARGAQREKEKEGEGMRKRENECLLAEKDRIAAMRMTRPCRRS